MDNKLTGQLVSSIILIIGIWQGAAEVALKKLKDNEHFDEFEREAGMLEYV